MRVLVELFNSHERISTSPYLSYYLLVGHVAYLAEGIASNSLISDSVSIFRVSILECSWCIFSQCGTCLVGTYLSQ
jgi:hypothetical protein